jgi:hypothetical protein
VVLVCGLAAGGVAALAALGLLRAPERAPGPWAAGWERATIDHGREDHDPYIPALSLVVDGGRLVGAGRGPAGCCDSINDVWTSTDGRRWRRDPHDPRITLDGGLFTGPWAFARHARRRVAVGTYERRRGFGNANVAAAWFSDGGGAWHRVPDDPKLFGRGAIEEVWWMRDGFVAFGSLYLAGERTAPMAWRSRDGRVWRRDAAAAARIPRDRHPDAAALAPMGQTRYGLVVVTAHASWRSRDGRAWRRTALPASPQRAYPTGWELHDTGRTLFAVRSYPPKYLPPPRTDDVPGKNGLEVMRSDGDRPFEALGAAFGPPSDAELRVIRKVPSGWLAVVGHGDASALWGSTDGRSFRRLTDGHSPFARALVNDIALWRSHIVLVGGVPLPSPNTPAYRATAWLHELASP